MYLGDKKFEFRKYNDRWNENTCSINRPVTISRGYGKKDRRSGRVCSFDVVSSNDYPSAIDIYGKDVEIAKIGIELNS